MDETNNLAPRERSNTNYTESLQNRSPFLALDLMPRDPTYSITCWFCGSTNG